MPKPVSKTKESNKSTKLDKNKKSDIKEKLYITRQVETSVAILDSAENDVVLESLLFLSKYVEINKNNLNFIFCTGIIPKLLKLFQRNICILRVSLHLLTTLIELEDVVYELDQDKYDANILQISDMYLEHKDVLVKKFCVAILAKLATSNRINTLIFKTDLFKPISEILKSSKDLSFLELSLKLLYDLLDAPAAISFLTTFGNFNLSYVVNHLNNENNEIVNAALNILEKLTNYRLPFLQEVFKELKLVEKLLKMVMEPRVETSCTQIFIVLHNCLDCEETSSYFIKSIEFITFCQWVKECAVEFLLPTVKIFFKLSAVTEIKQILFDLSVEESILYYLRSNDKIVLNTTCLTISNMTTHKYCCENMVTTVVVKRLIDILQRNKVEEDPENEVALKTIFDFTRRSRNFMNLLLAVEGHAVLLEYFYKKNYVLTETSCLMVLEILYKCSMLPDHQNEILTEVFLVELFKLAQNASIAISSFCFEIMATYAEIEASQKLFISSGGPEWTIKILKTVNDFQLFKNILFFIYCSMVHQSTLKSFLRSNLILILKDIPERLQIRTPLVTKILDLSYNGYLPIKFYEKGRLEVTDKLNNLFYLINGPWTEEFPFLEMLDCNQVCPLTTIYVVDYTYEVSSWTLSDLVSSQLSLNSSGKKRSSKSSGNVPSKADITSIVSSTPSAYKINYGGVSPDPYLPKYIHHINKYFGEEVHMKTRIRLLAEYVDALLCGPKEEYTITQKIHTFKLHIQCLKEKLGTSIIPIGFLRIGFHCEKSLMFKALADKLCISCSLVKGRGKLYWNEIAMFVNENNEEVVKFYVVDLFNNLGNLMLVGSREANRYCNFET